MDVSEEEAQISNRSKGKVSFYTPPLSKRMKDTGISDFFYINIYPGASNLAELV